MNIKKLLFIIAGLLLLGAIGGIAATFLTKAPTKPDKVVKKEVKPENLSTIALEEFLVNLADTSEQRYLKATVVLEVKAGPEAQEKMKEITPKIRDAVLTEMSRKRFIDLQSVSGKHELKNSIKKEVNRTLNDDLVNEVYFTSFAMQ